MEIELGVYERPDGRTVQVTYLAGAFALYREGSAGRQKATLRAVLARDLAGARKR